MAKRYPPGGAGILTSVSWGTIAPAGTGTLRGCQESGSAPCHPGTHPGHPEKLKPAGNVSTGETEATQSRGWGWSSPETQES